MNGLAWILATCPEEKYRNGSQAVGFAEKVSEGTDHRVAIVETTLSAAYAETGQFDRALSVVQTARRLATEAGETNALERATKVLEAVQKKKPYRDIPIR
jgi:hypothetical protein